MDAPIGAGSRRRRVPARAKDHVKMPMSNNGDTLLSSLLQTGTAMKTLAARRCCSPTAHVRHRAAIAPDAQTRVSAISRRPGAAQMTRINRGTFLASSAIPNIGVGHL
jgi:hypothetical protein